MEKFAFISRHTPTKEQIDMARAQDIELVWYGDVNAFEIEPIEIFRVDHKFVGAIVVHPAAALRLSPLLKIGVFENGNRAEAGEKPQFFAKALHIYDLRKD